MGIREWPFGSNPRQSTPTIFPHGPDRTELSARYIQNHVLFKNIPLPEATRQKTEDFLSADFRAPTA